MPTSCCRSLSPSSKPEKKSIKTSDTLERKAPNHMDKIVCGRNRQVNGQDIDLKGMALTSNPEYLTSYSL